MRPIQHANLGLIDGGKVFVFRTSINTTKIYLMKPKYELISAFINTSQFKDKKKQIQNRKSWLGKAFKNISYSFLILTI